MGRLRIALAQVDVTVGDLEGNARRLRNGIQNAREAGAAVVAFPELAVCGYPPEDLLLKPSFVHANREVVQELARETSGLTVVVGFVDRGLDLFNAAAILHDGAWVGTYHKQRLPNYGVFDELRYFKPGAGEALYQLGNGWLGVSICEDIWQPGGPVARMARAGADLIININASPYHRGKWRERHRMLATRASDHGVILGYVNLVGGQDELVFDGGSAVFGPDGDLRAEAASFEEDMLFYDLEVEPVFRARLHDPRRRHLSRRPPASVQHVVLSAGPFVGEKAALPARSPVAHDDVAEVYRALVLGTRDYVRKNGFDHVMLGLSGGIDSALVAVVAVDGLGSEAVTGVSLPSRHTSEGSRTDADALAAALAVELLTISIEDVFAAMLESLSAALAGREPDVTEENLQARIRGTLLMALSNKFGWLLLTTGNKSELATGYATLYGDMAGGFAILKDVPKTLVYELVRWRNGQPEGPVVPASILEKEPSAELRPDQKDTDSLPPYEVLDPILTRYVEQDWSVAELVAEGYDAAVVRQVIAMVDRNEYKRRQAAPGIKITPRAFGKDRRLPITSRYRQ